MGFVQVNASPDESEEGEIPCEPVENAGLDLGADGGDEDFAGGRSISGGLRLGRRVGDGG